jgi:hypothetical protein
MSGHTPGPWEKHFATAVAEQADGEWMDAIGITNKPEAAFAKDGDRGDLIAFVPIDGIADADANARLIATAPQLLSELKSVTDFLEQLVLHERVGLSDSDEVAVVDRLLMNAAAAIARAEGRA